MESELFVRRTVEVDKIKRVIVRGTNWVGDAVMTIPALRELRRVLPTAHLTLATRSSTAALFDEADFLDDLLIYDRAPRDLSATLRQTREWRARKFDLALLFQNAFEAAMIGFGARVPVRIGYAAQGRRPLLTHPIALPKWRSERHEVFYYLNLITGLEQFLYGRSAAVQHEPVFGLTVSDARRDKARALLSKAGAHVDWPLVVICPGSTNSRAKRWPADRFATLADKISRDLEADVALIGSRDELEVSERVASLMEKRPLMLTGRTDLAEAVAVLSLSDVLITNDTGPAHIAAALERPTLVIFGPTNPVTTRPFSNVAEIIRHAPDCAPCMLRDCPIDHRCMTAITPDEVFVRVGALIREHRVGVEA